VNVANGWAFWIGLTGALAVLYVLPTLIGMLRHVEILAPVVILNLFPIAWPAALVAACIMPCKEGC
jgi:Sec-independent protein secretion pathway component TatC